MAAAGIDLTPFFEAIETAFPPAGVRSTLDGLFGKDTTEALERVGVLKVLRVADTYPCPHPGGDGCPRQVVDCKDGSYVAVCGNNPPECDEVKLTPKDVQFLGVIPEKLFEALHGPLKISGAIKRVNGVPQAYRIGAFAPQPGNTHPVYFVAASSGDQYAVAFDALRSRADDQSFGLVTPTDRFFSEETERQFRTVGIPIIPLANTIRLTNRGTFEAVSDFLELFNAIGKGAAVETGAGEPKAATPTTAIPQPPSELEKLILERLKGRVETAGQLRLKLRKPKTKGQYSRPGIMKAIKNLIATGRVKGVGRRKGYTLT